MTKSRTSADPTAVDLSSSTALRKSLNDACKSGYAAWVRMDGLTLDDRSTHGAFCHTLTKFGLGADSGRQIARIAVLDWSHVEGCSAEGIAFFPVLVRRLVHEGVKVFACRPADRAIADVLECCGVLSACKTVEWVRCLEHKALHIESLAPAAIFDGDANETVDVFCGELSGALKRLELTTAARKAVMGTTQELLHNVLSHAGASHAAAIGILLPRKRPKLIQIGVADDGMGIRDAVLRNGRHEWLQWFHDASVTEAVLNGALSGRAETPDGGRGGGMARMIRRLLSENRSTVMLRSGAALITLRSSAPEQFVREALTYGPGTQVRVELRFE